MGLFDKLLNPVWHQVSALDHNHQRIAALLITGYDWLRATVSESLVEPLERSGLLPAQQHSAIPDLRERLLDEALIGLLKSCAIPENDPSGKIPAKIVVTLAEVWGVLALVDRNHRLKSAGPETLEQSHYSRDRDEARTQVLVVWAELAGARDPNFVAEVNKRWFYERWTELSVAYVKGSLTGFARTPNEILLKKAKSIASSIPPHRIATTRLMVETLAKVKLP